MYRTGPGSGLHMGQDQEVEVPYLLQESKHAVVVLCDPQLHGGFQQAPHHGNVRVIGRGQGHVQQVTDLLDTLHQDLQELLIRSEL